MWANFDMVEMCFFSLVTERWRLFFVEVQVNKRTHFLNHLPEEMPMPLPLMENRNGFILHEENERDASASKLDFDRCG